MNIEKKLSSSMRRFLYIVTKSEVIEEIKKFRKDWNIDPGGYKNKEKYKNWATATIMFPPIKLKRISISQKYSKYLIRKNISGRLSTGEHSSRTEIKATKAQLFNDNFLKAIDELGLKIGIDNNWSRLFSLYVLDGDKVLRKQFDAGIEITKTTEYYKKEKPVREWLNINVDPNTTREEIISAWERFIEKEKRSMVGYIDVPKKWKFKGFSPPLFVKRNPPK